MADKMGTAHILLHRLSVLRMMLLGMKAPAIEEPNEYYQFKPGSKMAGYVFMGWVGAWIWYTLHKGANSFEAKYWKKQVIWFLSSQRTVSGHMTNGKRCEQTCAGHHNNMHLASALMCALAAMKWWVSEVEIEAGAYLKANADLGMITCDEWGKILICGTRVETELPDFQPWSIVNSIIIGEAYGYQMPKVKKIEEDPHYLSVRLAMDLKKMNYTFGGVIGRDGRKLYDIPESLPFCQMPITIVRRPGEYLAFMEKSADPQYDKILQAVDWIHVRLTENGRTDAVEIGRRWESAPPAVDGETFRTPSKPLR